MGKGDRRKRSKEAEAAEKALRKRGRPKREDAARTPSGQISRADPNKAAARAEKQDDAMRIALTARARHAGLPIVSMPDGPRHRRDDAATLRAPWMGTFVGLSISKRPNVADLWQTVQTIIARRESWLRSIAAQCDHPRSGGLPVAPEKQDTSVTVERRYDDRTEEQRAEDAERLWSEAQDAMRAVNPLLQRAIILDEPVSGPVGDWVASLHEAMAR